MGLLLDTQIVLWQLQGKRPSGPRAREAIGRASELLFSIAEIGVTAAIGTIMVPDDLHRHIVRSGLRILGLAPDHGLGVADLPMHHRDPFDRLLIAQARWERLAVLTADARIARYGVQLLDAHA